MTSIDQKIGILFPLAFQYVIRGKKALKTLSTVYKKKCVNRCQIMCVIFCQGGKRLHIFGGQLSAVSYQQK
ncbi:MAG: hypothetical protein DRH11_15345 [Deltaproteobacteria bacterium]|nr:MAG: hypothetical protein DRH11_15345 [Deltaproteobacteria bacterium]